MCRRNNNVTTAIKSVRKTVRFTVTFEFPTLKSYTYTYTSYKTVVYSCIIGPCVPCIIHKLKRGGGKKTIRSE